MKNNNRKCGSCLYAIDVGSHLTVGKDMVLCGKPRKRRKGFYFYHKEFYKCRDWKSVNGEKK